MARMAVIREQDLDKGRAAFAQWRDAAESMLDDAGTQACRYKTVIVHSFVTPSIDARIFVVPRFIAVTFPRLLTVATLFF